MLATSTELCTGCSACIHICTAKALSMETNEEGFLYPVTDKKKCISCNQCNLVCPAQVLPKRHSSKHPKSYAAWNKDDAIRSKSSSGGSFHLLAREIISKHGVVFGAVFNPDLKVTHVQATTESELEDMLGSKYVQSDMAETYLDVKKLLENGKSVLFSGTPCQIAGLNLFLGKTWDNLLTVDLLCHGVPSPGVFSSFIKEKTSGNRVISIHFRDKRHGWNDFHLTIKTDHEVISESHNENKFMTGFLLDYINRKSCQQCTYNSIPRIADISLGDFWKIEQNDLSFNDGKGTSLLLLNTEKGIRIFNSIKSQLHHRIVPLSWAYKSSQVFTKPFSDDEKRKLFFSYYTNSSLPVSTIIDRVHDGETPEILNKVAIMNFHFESTNYGALMVPFALSTVLRKLGKDPQIINYIPLHCQTEYNHPSVFRDFQKAFLTVTKPILKREDLGEINDLFSTFIAGSDQVWRWHDSYAYLLNWVTGYKRLISYAASFGKDSLELPKQDVSEYRYYLSRFDAISVREKSGIRICRSLGCHAREVCDPTLLLSAADYEVIIDFYKPDIPTEPYYGYMFLDFGDEKSTSNIDELRTLSGSIKLINLMHHENGTYRNFGEWLGLIKHAKIIFTNSFHGSIFSLIFQKNFICVKRDHGGNSRIDNLFEKLSLSSIHYVDSISDITSCALQFTIDYNKLDEIIGKLKTSALRYLKESLAIQRDQKLPYMETMNDIFYLRLMKLNKIFRKFKRRIQKVRRLFLNR